MENKIVLSDTSVLIDYYRKTDKTNAYWFSLTKQGYGFAVSAITKYEIYARATQNQLSFWNDVFNSMAVLPFEETVVDTAVIINASLKRKSKQIELADLFIAATAITHKPKFATLNKKHFERIVELHLIK